jgi:hypothetical protein
MPAPSAAASMSLKSNRLFDTGNRRVATGSHEERRQLFASANGCSLATRSFYLPFIKFLQRTSWRYDSTSPGAGNLASSRLPDLFALAQRARGLLHNLKLGDGSLGLGRSQCVRYFSRWNAYTGRDHEPKVFSLSRPFRAARQLNERDSRSGDELLYEVSYKNLRLF